LGIGVVLDLGPVFVLSLWNQLRARIGGLDFPIASLPEMLETSKQQGQILLSLTFESTSVPPGASHWSADSR
jgi:hypothetical protein